MKIAKNLTAGLMLLAVVAVHGFASQAEAEANATENADPLHAAIRKVLMDIQQVEKKMGERLRVLRESSDRAKTLLEELGRIKSRQFEIEQELNGIWQQDEEYLELMKQRDELKASMDELFTTKAGEKDN